MSCFETHTAGLLPTRRRAEYSKRRNRQSNPAYDRVERRVIIVGGLTIICYTNPRNTQSVSRSFKQQNNEPLCNLLHALVQA